MRKIFLYFAFLILLLLPIKVDALREGITNYYIEATVLENGDLRVKELFVLNGEFNGFERIVNFANTYAPKFDGSTDSFRGSDIYNASNIQLISIKNIKVDNNIDFNYLYHDGDEFKQVSSANAGDYGKYTVTKRSNEEVYEIFNPSKGKERGFYVEYILKNIAISHSDVAEIGWNLFSNELSEYVNNLEMIINIPNNKNELRVWGHGPLNGYTELIGKNKIKYVINDLNSYTPIDVRFVFDKDVVKTSKETNITALDKILEVEGKRAEEENETRKEAAISRGKSTGYNKGYKDGYDGNKYDDTPLYVDYVTKEYQDEYKTAYIEAYRLGYDEGQQNALKDEKTARIFNVTNILWLFLLAYIIINVYNKYDKEYSSTFKTKYFRDFPKPYGPEIVGYLFRKRVDNSDLSASLLNLIAKKVITFEEGKKDDYALKYNKEKTLTETLTPAEKKLIDWFFEEIGNNGMVTMKDIKKEAKNNYEDFLSSFNSWKGLVEEEAINEDFFEQHTKVKVLGVLSCIIGIVLAIISFSFPVVVGISIIVTIAAVISMIYFIGITKRTKKGNEDYLRWKGLKRFLKDFGKFENRDLPQIHLWEKYLVYAVVFGCAKKLANTMKIKFAEMNNAGYTLMDAMFDIHYINTITNFSDSLNKSVTGAVSTALSTKAISESRSSSSGGFGGGFSGGGGSFGGGGGGGRF